MLSVMTPDNIRDLPIFAPLTKQEKDVLIKGGILRRIKRGQILFAHGDLVTHFYIIVKGTMQLFRSASDGHEKTIAIAIAGHTMCEDEIMNSCHEHRMNAMAVEDTTVLEFPVKWFKDAVQKYSNFAFILLSTLANRAQMAELEAEQHVTMSAAQLVACFIQRLCELYNFDPAKFTLPYKKSLIASRLGMELETFSRSLAKLKSHGVIIEGNQVMISDMRKIEKYVCGMCSISGECEIHQKLEKRIDLGESKYII